MELYLKHRPKQLKDVVGQEAAKKTLLSLFKKGKLPHVLMFTGPSGVGKTTIARIIAAKLGCTDRLTLMEVNAAESRGIDTIREIAQLSQKRSPIVGGNRVFIIDEAHKLTSEAQHASLKMLEDFPEHAYFMLATTEPHKLLATIRNRCTAINLKAIDDQQLGLMILSTAAAEKIKVSGEVIEKIVEISDGSARKALVLLHQISEVEGDKEQLKVVSREEIERQGIDIARALFRNASWQEIAAIIKEIPDTDYEGIRRMILGYASTIALSGGRMADRSDIIIDIFRDHWFDCGRAGLIRSCREVTAKK